MKYSFISMSICAILFICGACGSENGIDSGDETSSSRISLTIHVTVSCFDNLSDVMNNPITRTTEKGLSTQFTQGDAIGIFAIKGTGTKKGSIVDGINNTKLIYNETTKSWNTTDDILYWYDEVNYIAYYPYKENIEIDPQQSEKEIISSLATNTSLQPIKDQSNAENHIASDLMTAIGTFSTDPNNSIKKILTLNFTHQFVLLVLKPQVLIQAIKPPETAGFIYRTDAKYPIMDEKTTNVELNGITPFKMTDNSYRAIVLPSQTKDHITGKYETGNGTATKTITYSGSDITFISGHCYTLEVNSPIPGKGGEKTRELTPGDFVFQNDESGNIEIYPCDGPLTEGKIPDYDKAVGIVVTCNHDRMTDKKCNDKGWKHAYVMGLENTKDSLFWGVNGIDEDVITNTVRDEGAEKNMNGYTETEAMLNAHVADLDKYGGFNAIKKYREDHSVQENSTRSPWFIPSVGQWFDVMVNICGKSPKAFRNNTAVYSWIDYEYGSEMWNKMNDQLKKVNCPLSKSSSNIYTNECIYLLSSESNDYNFWHAVWYIKDSNRVELSCSNQKSTMFTYCVVRPFFAF